jgi:hypothetical protein
MEDLKNILKVIKKLTINNYDKQWKIYEFVVKNPDSIISLENNDFYRIGIEPFNKETFLTEEEWCTYNDCVKMIFWLDNDELYVTVKHYTHGKYICRGFYELELEWEAKIKLPIEFLKNIRTELNNEFEKYCDDKYEEYLLEQKHIWIENFKKTILD